MSSESPRPNPTPESATGTDIDTNPPPVHGGHGGHDSHPKRSVSGRARGVRLGIFTVVVLGGALVIGLVPRLKLQPELARAAEQEKTAVPLVTVVHPKAAPRMAHLELPGNIQGMEQAAVSARASGYLQRWLVDIGDHVKAGQPLAIISAPDADLQTAQANAQVANSAAGVQQSKANVANMQAAVDQAQANLSRAQATLQGSETDLAHANAALAQAIQAAEQQKSQVTQAQANLELAKVTSDRYTYLAGQGAVAQQNADQELAAYKTNLANVAALQSALKASQANIDEARASVLSSKANVKANADSVRASRAAVDAAVANVKAAQANVSASTATLAANDANYRRNAVLQSFQTVVAPFDGVITARNVDVGSLVSSTGNPAAAAPSDTTGFTTATPNSGLFSMVRTDRVRTYISLPQPFINSVQIGQTAQVYVDELGSKPFTGHLVRNTAVLDPASRTLSTEIQLSNEQGKLRPGMFATVQIDVPQPGGIYRIPDSALITDAEGTRVAIVTPDNKIHFQKVTVGTDYGKDMDITEGLTPKDAIVSNPSPSLQEGMNVQAVAPPKLTKPGGGGKKAS